MTSKPEPHLRPRRREKLVGSVRTFYSTLSDRAVVDACAGLFIVVAISLLLLRFQRVDVIPLPVGTVAPADILAPEDLKVEDVEQARMLRQRAVAALPPVFDFNPRASHDATAILNQIFEAGRQAPAPFNPDQFLSNIEQSTGFVLDPEQLDVLVKHNFNPELEKLMIDHLESIMVNGVVNNRTQLIKLGATGLLRRDTKSGQENVVTDLGSVKDLITGRAALRSEKLVWPSEYSARDRSLLGEILGALIVPNLTYNEQETESRKAQAQKAIAPIEVRVERHKPIVVRGETVSAVKAALLEQAAGLHRMGQRAVEFAGTLIIVLLLVLVLWQYLVRYQHRHIRVRRHFLLQIGAIVITLGLARIMFSLAVIVSEWASSSMFKSAQSYDYLAPLAVGALLVTLLTDAQAAFVLAAILAVFVGVLSNSVYLATYTLISSVGAIYHLKGCRDRTTLIRAGLWIGLLNASGALALDLLGANQPFLSILLFDVFCGFVSGLLATMVGSIFLPVFEWAFQITTDIKLLELSNLNLPLLRQLAERAPGTYHHSIMVGLLAEGAAEAVGGDALFARVACYYHDIGKMLRPSYFVENQTYLANRHDALTPRMSSLVLANHVKQGIELARSYDLPPRIVSVIPQHHGTGLMKYFYYKAREGSDDPDSATLEHEFRYPGPKPQSKEAAIIMIADSVEAA
ncbi:MAG TPA: HDIG domain-containing protein, partial [Blastocatellia bacterium]|nr:HDIG domain-containing protein [Blastocatellia bacterium]